jgi:hypothetical protein
MKLAAVHSDSSGDGGGRLRRGVAKESRVLAEWTTAREMRKRGAFFCKPERASERLKGGLCQAASIALMHTSKLAG